MIFKVSAAAFACAVRYFFAMQENWFTGEFPRQTWARLNNILAHHNPNLTPNFIV